MNAPDPAPVLVTRPGAAGARFVALLAERGVAATHVPALAFETTAAAAGLPAALREAGHVLVSSPRALDLVLAACPDGPPRAAFLVVGARSVARARAAGLQVDAVGPDGFDDLVRVLATRGAAAPTAALWPCGDLAARSRVAPPGLDLRPLVVYRTRDAFASGRTVLPPRAAAEAGGVFFWSPSAVAATRDALARVGRDPGTLAAYAIGASTARAARAAGFAPVHRAARPDDAALLALLADR